MDTFTPEQRSRVMACVGSKNTKPEKIVRSLLHHMGYRFRLHRKDLPGNPDIVLPRYKKVIFVHGCFWHGHQGCKRSTRPATNVDYWKKKIERNIKRDTNALEKITELKWMALTIWECELKDRSLLQHRLQVFLGVAKN